MPRPKGSKNRKPYIVPYAGEINGVKFRFLSNEKLDNLIKDYRDNLIPIGKICKKYRCSDSTAFKVLDAAGIKRHPRDMSFLRTIGDRQFRRSVVTDEAIKMLKRNYQLPMRKLREVTGINEETLFNLMKELGIKRKKATNSKVDYTDPDVQELIKNPWISNADIAVRYGVTAGAIEAYRVRHRVYVRKHVGRTVLEARIALILESLDLAYREQVKIGTKCVDFYLGNKIILEVDGEWAHKGFEREDEERDKYLFSFGYRVIHIKEKDVDQAESIITNELGGIFSWIAQREQ